MARIGTLNKIVFRPGLQKCVRASISQAVRSTQDPTLDKTAGTIKDAGVARRKAAGTASVLNRIKGKKKTKCILMPTNFPFC